MRSSCRISPSGTADRAMKSLEALTSTSSKDKAKRDNKPFFVWHNTTRMLWSRGSRHGAVGRQRRRPAQACVDVLVEEIQLSAEQRDELLPSDVIRQRSSWGTSITAAGQSVTARAARRRPSTRRTPTSRPLGASSSRSGPRLIFRNGEISATGRRGNMPMWEAGEGLPSRAAISVHLFQIARLPAQVQISLPRAVEPKGDEVAFPGIDLSQLASLPGVAALWAQSSYG
jgi:hypothetical protein